MAPMDSSLLIFQSIWFHWTACLFPIFIKGPNFVSKYSVSRNFRWIWIFDQLKFLTIAWRNNSLFLAQIQFQGYMLIHLDQYAGDQSNKYCDLIGWRIRNLQLVTYLRMNWDEVGWIDSITSFQSDGIDLPHRWCFSDCIVLVSDWPDIDITVVSGHLIGWFKKRHKILEHVWTRIWGNCCPETRINDSACFHIGLVNILFLDEWYKNEGFLGHNRVIFWITGFGAE